MSSLRRSPGPETRSSQRRESRDDSTDNTTISNAALQTLLDRITALERERNQPESSTTIINSPRVTKPNDVIMFKHFNIPTFDTDKHRSDARTHALQWLEIVEPMMKNWISQDSQTSENTLVATLITGITGSQAKDFITRFTEDNKEEEINLKTFYDQWRQYWASNISLNQKKTALYNVHP